MGRLGAESWPGQLVEEKEGGRTRMEGKLGWVALPSLPSYVEYQVNKLNPLTHDQASDKRNRNPNWTDAEITRFLMILMEEPVLNDLNAQRNKQVLKRLNFKLFLKRLYGNQVFCYVSRKMAGEGCEKT